MRNLFGYFFFLFTNEKCIFHFACILYIYIGHSSLVDSVSTSWLEGQVQGLTLTKEHHVHLKASGACKICRGCKILHLNYISGGDTLSLRGLLLKYCPKLEDLCCYIVLLPSRSFFN